MRALDHNAELPPIPKNDFRFRIFASFTFDLSVDIVTLLADLSFVANRWLALRPILTYLSVVTIH